MIRGYAPADIYLLKVNKMPAVAVQVKSWCISQFATPSKFWRYLSNNTFVLSSESYKISLGEVYIQPSPKYNLEN